MGPQATDLASSTREGDAVDRQDSGLEHDASDEACRAGAPLGSDQEELESTQIERQVPTLAEPLKDAPEPEAGRPILGVVVVYSDTHESDAGEVDSRLGRVYPLRDGEILFIGRHPAPREVLRRDGGSGPPDYCHLFPTGGIHGYISRRHLTIEMDPLRGTILTDYSRYGFYLEKAGKWHRRKDPPGPPESHRVSGDETVVLMDDLGEPTRAELVDRRSRYRFHIMCPTRTTGGASLSEEQP